MFQNLKVRVALILGLAALCVAALIFNKSRQGDIVTLGLDLKGGTYLALEIDDSKTALTSEQRADAIDRALRVVRIRVEGLGVSEPVVQKSGDDRIIVQLAGLQNTGSAKEVISKAAFLEFQVVRGELLGDAMPRMERAILAAFPNERGAAANPAGGPFQQKGADSAAAPTSTPFRSKIKGAGDQGQLLVSVADTAALARYLRVPAVQAALPRGTELLWGVAEAEENQSMRSLWLVDQKALMTGEHLESAVMGRDPQFQRPVVNFELSRRGGRIFGRETGRNIGKQMAIVLDQQVYTAPVIQSQISRNGQITLGKATDQEAADLALVLRAGALPAPLKIVEERTVGPSLGADSVNSGFVAGLIGLVGVVLIMIGYYRMAGFFAVIALSLYTLYTLGALAAMDAVLTFPGIAGIVLSIGMSVDANVLIFERIREELEAGRAVRPAVSEGFKQALSAIVDSNITTLLTAAILYYVGTGPIKGFAVTLGVGIVISMFTAIYVTRTLFILYLERRSAAAQGLSI
ncbi:protein translocase subunit SecD [Longimicrobium sp.]|uniref:protein translocase subunit SecD n=1 Tax=Longimicrobium sp. TaxID=2029185 RepID=UPI002E31402A|nr:protein translocase subunit SecD [Longimicrobium sp.]HEX6037023.1 protein translocase subunit SecD [Longimicrobium sp.]